MSQTPLSPPDKGQGQYKEMLGRYDESNSNVGSSCRANAYMRSQEATSPRSFCSNVDPVNNKYKTIYQPNPKTTIKPALSNSKNNTINISNSPSYNISNTIHLDAMKHSSHTIPKKRKIWASNMHSNVTSNNNSKHNKNIIHGTQHSRFDRTWNRHPSKQSHNKHIYNSSTNPPFRRTPIHMKDNIVYHNLNGIHPVYHGVNEFAFDTDNNNFYKDDTKRAGIKKKIRKKSTYLIADMLDKGFIYFNYVTDASSPFNIVDKNEMIIKQCTVNGCILQDSIRENSFPIQENKSFKFAGHQIFWKLLIAGSNNGMLVPTATMNAIAWRHLNCCNHDDKNLHFYQLDIYSQQKKCSSQRKKKRKIDHTKNTNCNSNVGSNNKSNVSNKEPYSQKEMSANLQLNEYVCTYDIDTPMDKNSISGHIQGNRLKRKCSSTNKSILSNHGNSSISNVVVSNEVINKKINVYTPIPIEPPILVANKKKVIYNDIKSSSISNYELNKRSNINFLYKRYGLYDCLTPHHKKYLVILNAKEKFASTQILSKTLISESNMKLMFEKVYIIQRVNYDNHNVQLYTACDLHKKIHFLVGYNGMRQLMKDFKSTVFIPNSEDFVPNELYNCRIRSGIRVINTNNHCIEMSLVETNYSESIVKKKCVPVSHLVYSALKKIATNTHLLQSMLKDVDKNKESNKRGKTISLSYGFTYNNVDDNRSRKTAKGGSFPVSFGYRQKLNDWQLQMYMIDMYKLIINKILDVIGLNDAMVLTDTMVERKRYAQKILKLLTPKGNNQSLDNVFSKMRSLFESGTFIIYENPNTTMSVFEMLLPHVDSLNSNDRNFNHTISISGSFPISDVKCSSIREKLSSITNYQKPSYQFSYILHTRKIIGLLDDPMSRSNSIQREIKMNSCAATVKILNIIDASGDTDLDYDCLFSNKKQYFNMIERFNRKDNYSIKEGYYQHGSIIIDKKASLDKLCYYSAAIDAYLSFLIKFKITEYKSCLAIALLFTIYNNGTTLFVQTINSLMNNQYLGMSNVNLFYTLSLLEYNKSIKIDLWVYLISTQTSWEIEHRMLEKNIGTISNPKIAASTSPRHTHSNILLPHSSFSDQEFFNKTNDSLLVHNDNLWLTVKKMIVLAASNKKENKSLLPQRLQTTIQDQCTIYCSNISKSNRGVGPFTAMTTIQFLSLIGILPLECSTFGHVSGKKTGTYKFFDNFETYKHKSVKERNRLLKSITYYIQKEINPNWYVANIENICCELSRTKMVHDCIFKMGYHQRIFNSKVNCSLHGFKYCIQNFYTSKINKKTGRMELHLKIPSSSKNKFTGTPVNDIIHLNGEDKTITIHIQNMPCMPFLTANDNTQQIQLVQSL